MKSTIHLLSAINRSLIPSAPEQSVISSSGNRWDGIKIENQLLQPMQMTSHVTLGHRLVINIGNAVQYEYRTGNKWISTITQPGNISLIEAGTENEVRWTDEPLHMLAIELNPAFTEEFAGMGKLSFREQRAIEDNMLYQLSVSLNEELQYGDFAGKLYGESVAIGFAIHIGTKYMDAAKQLFAPKGKLSAKQLKLILEYFKMHTTENVGLGEMSSMLCMSPFHFSRVFKNTTDMSPHQYMLRLKVERAIQLIVKKDASLTDIALSMGFNDQSHFIRVFKKITGRLPKTFAGVV
jgi:AraC family transcriptional regulator